jgi:tight adherence protein C
MINTGLLALLGAIALIAGGVVLVASGGRVQAERMARRVDSAMPRKASAVRTKSSGQDPAQIVQQIGSAAWGLTDAEQRQIVWLFSKIHVSADQAVPYFIAVRVVSVIAFGALAAAGAGHVAALAGLPTRLVIGVGASIFGWICPILIIARQLKRRTSAVVSGLPDALELLIVCVEAGLSLEDGLQRVAHELADSRPALAQELVLTWAEINILPSRAQALKNLAERIDAPGARSVVSILTQSLQLGTPLAQSLRMGAIEMRNDQMALMEERASRLPALLTIPVMLFIMPTIFMIIGGPAALRLMDTIRSTVH